MPTQTAEAKTPRFPNCCETEHHHRESSPQCGTRIDSPPGQNDLVEDTNMRIISVTDEKPTYLAVKSYGLEGQDAGYGQ